ncbi:hypothetical protein DENIS_0300 [Desulfonema ishimotonii]|uniref:Cohesin domain-containing protein n=1 Tax=Desulfonema ishimotonii TaxID=45657 RepID=A0A401FQX3_9BACT|nr:cohesin domain-containing protein [Desulfonema ishimotonii]GBC59361.1 hypothetical protein DENIS_0300 [Desulfonema ishimotonii]
MGRALSFFGALLFILLCSMPQSHALSLKLVPDGTDPSGVTDTCLIDSENTDDFFNLNIRIEDVQDMTGFDFKLTYDSSVVTAESVVFGDFLESDGLTAEISHKEIDNVSGALDIGICYYSSDASLAPDGDGLLATIRFALEKQGGVSDITLAKAEIGDINSPPFLPVDIIINAKVTPVYTVTPSPGTGGTIRPSGSATVAIGQPYTVRIAPDDCYEIRDVIVDGVSQGILSRYTFPGDDSDDHQISASFGIRTFQISASEGEGGTISPTEVSVTCGEDQTISVRPENGYLIQNVLVNGKSVADGSDSDFALNNDRSATYTLENIRANYTITASFKVRVPGDVNKDDSADLQDAILILQVLSGTDTSGLTISTDGDVDGDGRIGMAEVVYILRKVAASSGEVST